MRRPLVVGLLFGLLNALVGLAALVLVELLTPDDFGWFAYAPLDEAVVQDPRFPWRYVVVPLSLVLANVLAVPAYARWVLRR